MTVLKVFFQEKLSKKIVKVEKEVSKNQLKITLKIILYSY